MLGKKNKNMKGQLSLETLNIYAMTLIVIAIIVAIVVAVVLTQSGKTITSAPTQLLNASYYKATTSNVVITMALTQPLPTDITMINITWVTSSSSTVLTSEGNGQSASVNFFTASIGTSPFTLLTPAYVNGFPEYSFQVSPNTITTSGSFTQLEYEPTGSNKIYVISPASGSSVPVSVVTASSPVAP
jgi:hypothetical protein